MLYFVCIWPVLWPFPGRSFPPSRIHCNSIRSAIVSVLVRLIRKPKWQQKQQRHKIYMVISPVRLVTKPDKRWNFEFKWKRVDYSWSLRWFHCGISRNFPAVKLETLSSELSSRRVVYKNDFVIVSIHFLSSDTLESDESSLRYIGWLVDSTTTLTKEGRLACNININNPMADHVTSEDA